MQETNQILTQTLFPGKVIQLWLIAERRMVCALIEYDDHERTNLTISAQFFTPYVLAAVAHSSFLLMRIHSVSEVALDNHDPDDPVQPDFSEGIYCNLPGYLGENANRLADEQERAQSELQDHVVGGGRVQ